MDNIFYFSVINSIGGVESFYYYLAKMYKNYDIVIFYKKADPAQLNRLSKYVRCEKYIGQKIKCKRAFFNYASDIIDNVEAEEYIQIIHADYKSQGVRPVFSPKITKFIGVSKETCRAFKEYTGRDIELCYNPISIDEPVKPLRLISATRLTREKGVERIKTLAFALSSRGIDFTWEIYTNTPNLIRHPSIVYRPPKLDITGHIKEADYLVQLSDSEAYCYSVAEALMVGTPVIVTDCPVFKEIGVKDGVNGFVVGHDMKDLPIDKIVEGLEPFEYKPVKDGWKKLLVKGTSRYGDAVKLEIEILKPYYDLVMERDVAKGEIMTVETRRASILVDKGLARVK